ncbi:hypothetical protein AB0O76_32125 [Streptomyces sp. NPDC086554]|uniref:hypothetical protein n=1 Tax=Streptomyces sp. NPDC086554 TaxID=3154864 RepID=UPI003431F961
MVIGNRGSSDSEQPDASAADKGAASTAPSDAGSAEQASPKVRFSGTVRVELPNGGENVDLDSTPPLVSGPDIKGVDVYVGATSGSPTLTTEGSELTLAPLPGSGPAPSEAECADAVEKNGAYAAELTRGSRFCAQTMEGRTAYLRTVSAPTAGPVRIAATVWELPS